MRWRLRIRKVVGVTWRMKGKKVVRQEKEELMSFSDQSSKISKVKESVTLSPRQGKWI